MPTSAPPPPPEPTTPTDDPGFWLDRLEDCFLRGAPQREAQDDTTSASRCLERLEAHAAAGGYRAAQALAGATLVLTQRLERARLQPTSAMLDTMMLAAETLRAQLDSGSDGDDAPGAGELESLLLDLQTLAATSPAAVSPVALEDPPGSVARAVDAHAWSQVNALLAALGSLLNAQAGVARALADQPDPPAPALERALSQVEMALRSVTAPARTLRAAYPVELPAAPHLLEVVGVRAGAVECLVPADAVIGCTAEGDTEAGWRPTQGEAASPAQATAAMLDIAQWFGSFGTLVSEERSQGRQILTVRTPQGLGAWLVDKVLFQRPVVLQSLDVHFRPVPGLAGAAIMDGEQVWLVLDPATMQLPP